jgi:hypothetical protein
MNIDFETDLSQKQELYIVPEGWKSVVIEYGFKEYGAGSSWEVCWRIKGTQHIFRIPLKLLYEHSQGDYEKHFKEVLEIFREDYLEWYREGFSQDWMRNYRNQYSKFIFTF